MIFGKIDFINLLPFHIYLKKHIQSSQIKSIIEHNKSYPSNINKKFLKTKVHSAFISSIASYKKKSLNIGIVAKNEVDSVLLIPGAKKDDYQSQTSNALAKVLNLDGEVIIGDKALRYFYENKSENFIDLAKQWKDKYNLPFVFAVLCFNKNGKQLKNIVKNFKKEKIKIPRYILKQYSDKSNISEKNILNYLSKIDYEISQKERKSLNLFFRLCKQKGLI
jgi:chorismate dehydratase